MQFYSGPPMHFLSGVDTFSASYRRTFKLAVKKSHKINTF